MGASAPIKTRSFVLIGAIAKAQAGVKRRSFRMLNPYYYRPQSFAAGTTVTAHVDAENIGIMRVLCGEFKH
jgi:hypothetical protein